MPLWYICPKELLNYKKLDTLALCAWAYTLLPIVFTVWQRTSYISNLIADLIPEKLRLHKLGSAYRLTAYVKHVHLHSEIIFLLFLLKFYNRSR